MAGTRSLFVPRCRAAGGAACSVLLIEEAHQPQVLDADGHRLVVERGPWQIPQRARPRGAQRRVHRVDRGASVVRFPRASSEAGGEGSRQYDVARDGRFLINTVPDDAAAPITAPELASRGKEIASRRITPALSRSVEVSAPERR